MTYDQIEKYRQRLCKILKEDETKRLEDLKELANKVGASFTRMGQILAKKDIQGKLHYRDSNLITEMEIVGNINDALRTEAMIETGKLSKKNVQIALFATVTALLATIAAWCTVLID